MPLFDAPKLGARWRTARDGSVMVDPSNVPGLIIDWYPYATAAQKQTLDWKATLSAPGGLSAEAWSGGISPSRESIQFGDPLDLFLKSLTAGTIVTGQNIDPLAPPFHMKVGWPDADGFGGFMEACRPDGRLVSEGPIAAFVNNSNVLSRDVTVTVNMEADPSIEQMHIDWGDGSAATVVPIGTASGATFTHTYATAVNHTATLRSAWFEESTTTLFVRDVVVGPTVPARFQGPEEVTLDVPDLTVTIEVTNSPLAEELSINWGDFGSSPTVVPVGTVTGATFTHTFGVRGQHTVTLLNKNADIEDSLSAWMMFTPVVKPEEPTLPAAQVFAWDEFRQQFTEVAAVLVWNASTGVFETAHARVSNGSRWTL